MQVYMLQEGSTDIEGNDSVIGIHHGYDTAMGYAKVIANKIVRQAEDEGRTYKVAYAYGGDSEGKPFTTGKVSVYAEDPSAPDYWYTVTQMIVNP